MKFFLNHRYNQHLLMPKEGPVLRDEFDGVWYLEVHPEVAEFFK
jgi:hypothetical protein